jgi:hypothetical protein
MKILSIVILPYIVYNEKATVARELLSRESAFAARQEPVKNL